MRARKSSQDRKAEILATTLALAFEVGPGNVTTGMIAKRLGLTQPAIYKHFPNKKDIWHEVTNTFCTRIRENLRQSATANDPPLAILKQLVLGHLRLVTETPALPEIIVARDPDGDLTGARQHIHAAMGEFRETLRGKLAAAYKAGHLHRGLEIGDAEMLIFGVIQSLVLRLIVTRNPALLEQDGERLLDLQLSLMKTEGEPL
jgi:AcrR family transcriptional regulator